MHLRKLRFALSVALSVSVLGTASAHAQQSATKSPQSDSAQLRARIDQAERAYAEGRYADAAENYLEADRLQPSPALQLALGRTYEQMNDPSRALASYREYFARSPRAADRAQIQARVAALAAQLAEKGVQQISVSSVPPGATVVIDSKPLGTTPIYVDLAPGSHKLEFHRDGYESAGLTFDLSAQQPLNVMTTLVPLRPGAVAAATPAAAAAAAPTETAAAEAPAATEAPAGAEPVPEPTANELAAAPPGAAKGDKTTRYLRGFGFGALGGSVLSLGTAVAFELMRSQSESRARQQRQQIAFKDTIDTMHNQQTLARGFAVAAGVLAAAGGVLLVIAANRNPSEPPPDEGAAIACAPTGCSAVYQGSF